MRVAVHEPDGTVFAYRFGRVQDTPDPITGENIPAQKIVDALVDQAKAEYPDGEVVVERLVEDGEESTWEPIDPPSKPDTKRKAS